MSRIKIDTVKMAEAVEFIVNSVTKGKIPNGAYPQAEQRFGFGYQTIRRYVNKAHPELVGRVRTPKAVNPTVAPTGITHPAKPA